MATSDARTSVGSDPGTGLVYDGFISYSHAADDLLAPRLQSGLQRFAKPWWKRRALRIFRDETSLAANPHLWSSITDALDQSGWFVLLLSPDAAESVWVNREVEYWLEHKDGDRIIPAVTDGDFQWLAGDIDARSTAAPPALYGAFADEPRWVDLRFARTEEHLDLNNTNFRAAIADIASAIRGVPKDELESEEVRQHRRTKRTAWAAALALVALTAAAVGAAFLAVDRGNEASEQRIAAEQNAAEANAHRQVAEELAAEAQADALAANAIAQLDVDPALSLLLATEALQREPQPSALSATHQALQRHRVLFQISLPPDPSSITGGAVGGMSPSGDLVAVATGGRVLQVWEVGGDEPLWTADVGESHNAKSARFTDDGSAVVAYADIDRIDFDSGPNVGEAHRLVVFDSATGQEVGLIPLVGCGDDLFPTAMSDYVDLNAPVPWVDYNCVVGRLDVGLMAPLIGVRSFAPVTEIAPGSANNSVGVPTTDSDGRRLAVGSSGPGQVIDLETGEVIFSYDGGISTLSADGSLLLARGHGTGRPLELWDLASNEQLWAFSKSFTRGWFSSDETMVYGTSPDGSTYVLDAATGRQILRLEGQGGVPLAATMSTDGTRLATFATDFTTQVWDLGEVRSEGDTYVTGSQPREYLAASADLAAGVAAVWGGTRHQEDSLWEVTVVELSSGETLLTVAGGAPALSPDGTRLAYRAVDEVNVAAESLNGLGEPGIYARVGPVRVIDLDTSDLIVEIDVPCQTLLLAAGAVPTADCRLSSSGEGWDLEFSPDGRLLSMADSYSDISIVWDATTGQIVATDRFGGGNQRATAFTPDQQQVLFLSAVGGLANLRIYDLDPFRLVKSIPLGGDRSFAELVFTPDGSILVAADNSGDIALIDATTWEVIKPIRAHQGSVLDVAIDPTGTLIASAGEDAYVRVWNLDDRSIVTEIKFEVDEIANVEFIDATHLFITPGFGEEAIIITLDPDELLHFARSRISRSFTQAECTTYSIDPCPTLEDIIR